MIFSSLIFPASSLVRLPADSSSDYSQRTGYELLQQEFRTTPEGAQREAEDPLPDRIKVHPCLPAFTEILPQQSRHDLHLWLQSLIREVHQEGMQVLSLSELPLSEGEPGRHAAAPGWLKERDGLLATLESLKALIAQMQTQVQEPAVLLSPPSLQTFGLNLPFSRCCCRRRAAQTGGRICWTR